MCPFQQRHATRRDPVVKASAGSPADSLSLYKKSVFKLKIQK